MEKVYQGRFDFPNPYPGAKLSRCLLRVYREPPDWKGPLVAIATEVLDNPGASITNAAEALATRIWQEWTPDSANPPLLFDHYSSASYERPPGGARRGDQFSLVTFGELTRKDPNRGATHGLVGVWVLSPRWQWVPGSLVARLVGEPQAELGDGFDHKPRTSGDDDGMEREDA